jgi:hypothetical protein
VSDWPTDLLKEHLETLMRERDIRYEQRFNAQEAATAEVKSTTDQRFAAVNEFRGAMSDRDRLFMPRAEAEQRINQTDAKVTAMEERVNLAVGRSTGVNTSWGVAAGLVGLVLTAAAIMIRFV